MRYPFRLPLLLMLFSGTVTIQAQSIAALQRQAEKNATQGNYAEAAALFERAGRLNKSDPALLFQAAEAYSRVRDYLNASNGYRAAKDDPRFPLAYLRYARTLKQLARYEEAREAFQKTRENYRGDHREVILQVVENEIAGCDLAVKTAEQQQDTLLARPSLAWLPPPVASPQNEFAPLPFSDTLLYFSQARKPQSVLMRSTRRALAWQSPKEAFGLPSSAAKDFLCGSFSPDGQRFYFARSDKAPDAAQGSSVQSSVGTLYVLRHNASGEWGEPERLRSYINLQGSSNLWPFICHLNDEEWLFFASDRPGGMGGIDLYCCKRPLASDDLDFSFPLNLGNKVNTGADEITPYYDIFSNTLWFSSIGHPSLGGLDVFSSVGGGNNWTAPENAGVPVNSPADDFFFVLKRDGSGAFLVSNRTVAKEKTTTADDDIFEISFPEQD